MTARYDGDIPGWGGLARHDRLILGDFDGDGAATSSSSTATTGR